MKGLADNWQAGWLVRWYSRHTKELVLRNCSPECVTGGAGYLVGCSLITHSESRENKENLDLLGSIVFDSDMIRICG